MSRSISLPDVMGTCRRWVSTSAARAVDALLPPRCMFCEGDLPTVSDTIGSTSPRTLLCADCQTRLVEDAGPTCPRCAGIVPQAIASPQHCPHCRGRSVRFDRVIALGPYEGELREAVLRAKQSTGTPLAAELGRLFWKEKGQELRDAAPDVVTAIPMHWTRRMLRGANNPEAVAESLARALGVPCTPGMLVRRRRTAPLGTLRGGQRWATLRRAMRTGWGYRLDGARILVVDDILTSAATANEAARALKQAGASIVIMAVLARADVPIPK